MISFYNIQFYNQGSTTYGTAASLFNSSGGWAPGTSVNEIIAKGIPSDKIVVGKPATTADAYNTGYMTASDLSNAFVAAYNYNKWRAGVMFWQYPSDNSGTIVGQAISSLMSLVGTGSTSPPIVPVTPVVPPVVPVVPVVPPTNTTTNPPSTNAPNGTFKYPIRFAYSNRVADWSSAAGIAASMGVPGYAKNTSYNFICLTFYTCSGGPTDTALVWSNPIAYMGTTFGSTNAIIRSTLKTLYANAGIKLMVSAFGSTENPTSAG
jgi:hypothetical protein